jgi:EAL domain-containing protein (putative c-di-GMP-specific phosphodiesterase class I)
MTVRNFKGGSTRLTAFHKGFSVPDIQDIDAAGPSPTMRLRALQLDTETDAADIKVEVHELIQLCAAVAQASAAHVLVLEADRLVGDAQTGTLEFELSATSPYFTATMEADGCLVIPDAKADARFAAAPLIIGGREIRFFAGVALRLKSGKPLGALCLFDYEPRELRTEQLHSLSFLAGKLSGHIEFRGMAAGGHRSDNARQRMLKALRRTVDAGEFDLHYQPKVDLRTNRIVGLEALLRWDSEVFGPVSPAGFVPLLEESGLILPVGIWVIQRAIADYRLWFDQGLDVGSVAVNVSPVQLADTEFASSMEKALGGSGARAPIDIEITEGMLLAKTGSIIRKLHAIRGMGVQIAIDDFGTGYSSLRYLAHLPIDTLKIDRSFVAMMADEADDMSIVSSVIALAHGLDLDVVAEGVETKEQRKLLSLLRCDQMQGFLFSPPVPKHAIADMMIAESNVATHRNPVLATADIINIAPPERRRNNRPRR